MQTPVGIFGPQLNQCCCSKFGPRMGRTYKECVDLGAFPVAANKSDSLRGRVSFPLKGYEYVIPTRRGVPLIRLVGKGPTRMSCHFRPSFPGFVHFRSFFVIFAYFRPYSGFVLYFGSLVFYFLVAVFYSRQPVLYFRCPFSSFS